jgi:Domain of unknown function (DUF4185)
VNEDANATGSAVPSGLLRLDDSISPRLKPWAIMVSLLGRSLLIPFVLSLSIGIGRAQNTRPDAEFTAFFQRTNGWTSGDGATSIPLSDGRVLWLFGDSHIDDIDPKSGTMPCLFQARNAGMVHRTNDLQNVVTLAGKSPGPRTWFRNSTNEWFWPVCGFQQDRAVYVYLAALRNTGEGGMWGFTATGTDYWARISFPDLSHVTYSPLPRFNGITFGNGFVREVATIYAFGGKGKGLASDLFVARFEASKPETNWTFWDGKRWQDNVTNAVPIGKGASSSLHVCKPGSKYVLTTSAFSVACDQGKDILLSTATKPTGPFSALRKIYSIQDTYKGHSPFFYFPILHPEFTNPQGEILLTYSINGYEPCISACLDGRAIPDHYRPKAIRVKLD